jgi:hypothetical protein
MSIRFECPNGHKLVAEESQSNKTLACPKCGEGVRVPSIATAPIEIVSKPANSKPAPETTVSDRSKILLAVASGALAVGLLSGLYLLLRKPTSSSLSNEPVLSSATLSTDPEAIKKKLRAIGIAWMNFESQTKRFIPVSKTQLSWRVHLLPYLDQGPLYAQFQLDEAWDSPHNIALVKFMPEVFNLPGSSQEEGKTRIQTPTGQNLVFGSQGVPSLNKITDGFENTLLAVVAGQDKATVWTKPDDLQIQPDAPIESLGKLMENFICGISANANPIVLKPDVSPFDFYALLTPRGGEAVDLAQLTSRFEQSSTPNTPMAASPELVKLRKNKLRDVGQGILNYESAFKQFPIANIPAYFDENNKPKLSWRVHLLPYFDQRPLYEMFKLEEPWDSPHNLQLLQKMPEIYRDPADPIGATKTRVVRFTGPNAPFQETGPGPKSREFTDGAMSTLLLICCGADKAIPWTKPDDLPFDQNAPVACLGKIDGQVFIGAFADNRVVAFDVRIPPEVFKCYVTHQGKEVVGENPFLISN